MSHLRTHQEPMRNRHADNRFFVVVVVAVVIVVVVVFVDAAVVVVVVAIFVFVVVVAVAAVVGGCRFCFVFVLCGTVAAAFDVVADHRCKYSATDIPVVESTSALNLLNDSAVI